MSLVVCPALPCYMSGQSECQWWSNTFTTSAHVLLVYSNIVLNTAAGKIRGFREKHDQLRAVANRLNRFGKILIPKLYWPPSFGNHTSKMHETETYSFISESTQGRAVAELRRRRMLGFDRNTGPCHQTRWFIPSEPGCNPIGFNSVHTTQKLRLHRQLPWKSSFCVPIMQS